MGVIGYIAAVFIGLSLGVFGGGGSILTVPVLVYLFGLSPLSATVYSLFIVGGTSISGSVSYFKKGQIDFKNALIFGIPSLIAVFITRRFVVPNIPNEIFSIGDFTLTNDLLLLLLFAVLMIIASFSMIKRTTKPTSDTLPSQSIPLIVLEGTSIGFITALVGAGGGFLIIPVLVNFLHLPIKKAVGTSLFIISINSFLGFFFSLSNITINWNLLLIVTTISIIGVFIGSYIAMKVDEKKLKSYFGWFILVIGIYIILKETLL